MTTDRLPEHDHHLHAHLDGGRCLDGSGRSWEPTEPGPLPPGVGGMPVPAALGPVELSLLLRRVASLSRRVTLLASALALYGAADLIESLT